MIPIQDNDEYIGQLLVRERVITEEELEKGLEEQHKNHSFLCESLVRLGFASEEKIFSILSLQIGIPFVNLQEVSVDPLALNRVPGKLAQGFKCIPLRVVDDVFYVAMADPLNTRAVQEIKDYLNVDKVKIFLAGENDIHAFLSRYYGI
jgi:type IV pilus assembly protein PilB